MSSVAQSSPGPSRLVGDAKHRRRKLFNKFMEGLSTSAAVVAIAVLVFIVVIVVIKAAPAISFGFLFHNPHPTFLNPAAGGIANAIVGSALLIALASVIAVPIAILVAVFTSEYESPRALFGRHPALDFILRKANEAPAAISFLLDLLNGVPTIITGIFIYGLLVLGHAPSGWAGAIALAIVELPIVARSVQEVLALVPSSLREAGLALGLRRWRIVLRIILPTAAGGIITGAVLGVARVAGETAPLVLLSPTLVGNVGTVVNPSQSLPNIPTTIFNLADQPGQQAVAAAWASALVLIVFVLIVSVTARTFNERSRRKLGG